MEGENFNETDIEYKLIIDLLKKFLEYKGIFYRKILIITHHSVILDITCFKLNNSQSITIIDL